MTNKRSISSESSSASNLTVSAFKPDVVMIKPLTVKQKEQNKNIYWMTKMLNDSVVINNKIWVLGKIDFVTFSIPLDHHDGAIG